MRADPIKTFLQPIHEVRGYSQGAIFTQTDLAVEKHADKKTDLMNPVRKKISEKSF